MENQSYLLFFSGCLLFPSFLADFYLFWKSLMSRSQQGELPYSSYWFNALSNDSKEGLHAAKCFSWGKYLLQTTI